MNPKLLDYLICPSCQSDQLKLESFEQKFNLTGEGILICEKCLSWYLITNFVLELIKDDLNFKRKMGFWQTQKNLHPILKSLKPPSTTTNGLTILKTGQDEFFSQHDYDFVNSSFWKANDKKALSRFGKQIQPNWLVCDIGCGPGRSSIPLIRDNFKIIGFDIAWGLVERAIQESIRKNLTENLYYFVADAENIPLKSGVFDAIIIYGVLHHVSDPQKVLKEGARILKENGLYFGHENAKSVFRFIFDLLMKFKRLWREEAGIHPLFSEEELLEIATRASLKVKITHSVFLPPHLFNLFNDDLAQKLLEFSDLICQKIPFLKKQGGVLLIKGVKTSSTKRL